MNTDQPIQYDFLCPRSIVFGWGRRREVGALAQTLGQRAFLVHGLPDTVAGNLVGEIGDLLRAENVDLIELEPIEHEPEVIDVDQMTSVLRQHGATDGDLVIGLGGGAAMDMAKAAAAMAVNRESDTVKDYLENVGRDFKITEPPLPVLAMPTTAGTGAEATKNAVISSYDPPFKKSLREKRLMPSIALIDPELCVSVPPSVTAASGMDAITQLIESYISRKTKQLPRALAAQGLPMAMSAIVEAVENGESPVAREKMSHAALLSGMALANSGLGMAHGVAPALGTHCRVPHGVACALMLPTALRVNREVCEADLAELAALVLPAGSSMAASEAVDGLIDEIQRLGERVGIPRRLSDVGVRGEQIPALVKSSRGNSMSGNPVELSDQQLTELLEGLL